MKWKIDGLRYVALIGLVAGPTAGCSKVPAPRADSTIADQRIDGGQPADAGVDQRVADANSHPPPIVVKRASFYDYFIGAAGDELTTHGAHPFWDWLGEPRFAWHARAGVIVLQNNLGVEGRVRFRAEVSSAPALYTASFGLLGDQRLAVRVFLAPELDETGLAFRLQDNSDRFEARLDGARQRLVLSSVIGGQRSVLATSADGTVRAGRMHSLEIELVGNRATIFVDEEPLLVDQDVAAVQGSSWGLSADTIGAVFRELEVVPHRPVQRRYVAEDGNDSADGSYGAPWKTIDKVNHATAANAAGFRYLFKSGDVFNGLIEPRGSGTGRGWEDADPLIFGTWGAAIRETQAEITRLNAIATARWNGPNADGEYTLASQPQTRMFLLEDDVRLNGASSDFTIAVAVNAGLVPQKGSLEPGQWALDESADVLYMKPSSGTPAAHHYEIAANSAGCVRVVNRDFVWIRDLYLRGSSASSGMLNVTNGGSFSWVHRVRAKHGVRGIITGSGNGVMQHWRQTECEASSMTWRAISTSGGAVTSAARNGLVAHNFVHDCFRLSADYGDHESIMLGPGDNDGVVEFNYVTRIGFADPALDVPGGTTTMHPGGIAADSANNMVARYNWLEKIRLSGIVYSAREDQAITGGHAYNNVIYDCGKIDTGNRGRHTALHLRANNGVEASGVLFENNSIVDCAYVNKSSFDGAMVVYSSKDSPLHSSSFVNNLVAHYRGALFIHSTVFGTPSAYAYAFNHNLYHRADSQTTAVEYRPSGGPQKTYDMSHFVAGSSAGTWSGDEGQDQHSLIGDPQLEDLSGRDFHPKATSPAVGGASAPSFDENLDFFLKPRPEPTIGAFAPR